MCSTTFRVIVITLFLKYAVFRRARWGSMFGVVAPQTIGKNSIVSIMKRTLKGKIYE